MASSFLLILCFIVFILCSNSNVDGLVVPDRAKPTNQASIVAEQSSRRSFLHGQVASMAMAFLPYTANAYERRDVGDNTRSATTAAFNEAAYVTNNRLEKEGFKLDSREDEQKRLSEAMASFSYESATPKRQNGYRTSSAATAASSKTPQK